MTIKIDDILKLVTAIPALIDTVTDIVDGVKTVISADDAATLDHALATIQKQNDEGYKRVRALLVEAAKR